MENVTCKKISEEVLQMLNSFENVQSEKFIKFILEAHPTLQQRFMSEIVIRFIREFSGKKFGIDGRNDMTKEICDKIFSLLRDEGKDQGLPMI